MGVDDTSSDAAFITDDDDDDDDDDNNRYRLFVGCWKTAFQRNAAQTSRRQLVSLWVKRSLTMTMRNCESVEPANAIRRPWFDMQVTWTTLSAFWWRSLWVCPEKAQKKSWAKGTAQETILKNRSLSS